MTEEFYAKIQEVESEKELEKQTRIETTERLQETLQRLQATHAEETLRLTRELTVSEALGMRANLRIHELEEQLSSLVRKTSEKEHEIYSKAQKIEDLETSKSSLSADFSRINQQHAAEISQHRSEIEEFQRKEAGLSTIKTSLESAKSEIAALKQDLLTEKQLKSNIETDMKTMELALQEHIARKVTEFADFQKETEREKRFFEEKIKALETRIQSLGKELASCRQEKEEFRLEVEALRKQREALQDDQIRLSAVLETHQKTTKSMQETSQNLVSRLQMEVSNSNSENKILNSRLQILEDAQTQLQSLSIQHELLEKEHRVCEGKSKQLNLAIEELKESSGQEKQRLEANLRDEEERGKYILHAFRVRETALIEANLQIENLKRKVQESREEMEEDRLRPTEKRTPDGNRVKLKEKEIALLQHRISTQDALLSELQEKLISALSEQTKSDKIQTSITHKQLVPTVLDQTRFEEVPAFVKAVQKVFIQWENSLSDRVQSRIFDPQSLFSSDYQRGFDKFLNSLFVKLADIKELIDETNPTESIDSKLTKILHQLDSGKGPIEDAVTISLLLENLTLKAEIVKKAVDLLESERFFNSKSSKKEDNSREIWAIEKWHDSEKESLRLRTALQETTQRLADFYRSKEQEKKEGKENERLRGEIATLSRSLSQSQVQIQELEGLIGKEKEKENQQKAFEVVISELREQVGKTEKDLERRENNWKYAGETIVREVLTLVHDLPRQLSDLSTDSPESLITSIQILIKAVKATVDKSAQEQKALMTDFASKTESWRTEKLALSFSLDQAKLDADRLRAETGLEKRQNGQLRADFQAFKTRLFNPDKSHQVVSKKEMSGKRTVLIAKLTGDLEESKLACTSLQTRVQSLKEENLSLRAELTSQKSLQETQLPDLLKELQGKTQLIEKLLGDSENTKRHYHKKQLELMELLSEKEETLQRSQLESASLRVSTANLAFSRKRFLKPENKPSNVPLDFTDL